jgi:uncharacterized membrane protein (UPF0127 family)
MTLRLWNQTRDRGVVDVLEVVKTPWGRMKGLLGRRELEDGHGLLLEDCSGIHTWFMQFPIDVVFLDRDLRVQKVVPDLWPWRAARAWGATHCLELAAGVAARRGLAVGDTLQVQATSPTPGRGA